MLDDATKQRLVESAQSGGIRLKCMIDDASAAMLAYGLDDPSLPSSKVAVIDIGWSSTQVSICEVSGGLFFPRSSLKSSDISGKVLVKLLAEHCVKEFQRKSKLLCSESNKAMLRLRRECEDAVKVLSTGAEATIDIDSLYEGVDYSTKITRARFEDLISIPLVQLKKVITDAVTAAGTELSAITLICLSGGITSVPRVQTTIKSLLTVCRSKEFCLARLQFARLK